MDVCIYRKVELWISDPRLCGWLVGKVRGLTRTEGTGLDGEEDWSVPPMPLSSEYGKCRTVKARCLSIARQPECGTARIREPAMLLGNAT